MSLRRYGSGYYKKARWSSNIGSFRIICTKNDWSAQDEDLVTLYRYEPLCLNPAQSNQTVSQEFTVKNVEIQLVCQSRQYDKLDDITIYIMFRPQGMNVDDTYPESHPEFILAWRFMGQCEDGGASNARNAVVVKSRLARKLNTGDSIILYVKYNDNKEVNQNQFVNH